MFVKSSRYYNQKVVTTTAGNSKKVKVITLRRLPDITGIPVVLKDNERLDIIAQKQYNNGTLFWHIADANSELESSSLQDESVKETIIPES